jgi:hypothetical protein
MERLNPQVPKSATRARIEEAFQADSREAGDDEVDAMGLGIYWLQNHFKILDIKYKREAMELARDRNELIERALVIRQLTYMMINTRQRLLALPGTMRARFGEAFSRKMIDGARELIHQALTELSEMPLRGIDPDWLEQLDDDDGSEVQAKVCFCGLK